MPVRPRFTFHRHPFGFGPSPGPHRTGPYCVRLSLFFHGLTLKTGFSLFFLTATDTNWFQQPSWHCLFLILFPVLAWSPNDQTIKKQQCSSMDWTCDLRRGHSGGVQGWFMRGPGVSTCNILIWELKCSPGVRG